MGCIPYDRANPEHPRLKDVWGRTYAGRPVRVVVCGITTGATTVTFRYVSSRHHKRVDLGRFLAEWRLLSRWPGLDPERAE